MRRAAMLGGAVGALAMLLFFTVAADLGDRFANRVLRRGPYTASAAAATLHRTLFVADLHADPLLWGRDLRVRGTHGHIDLPRLREGGVALQVFSAVTSVPSSINYDRNDGRMDVVTLLAMAEHWPVATWGSLFERALYEARRLRAVATDSGGRFVIVTDAATLQRFAAHHRTAPEDTAGLLAIEGMHAAEGDLHKIDALYDAGFRMMGLTHFFDNELGGSAHGAEKHGLSDFGRQVVRRLEERHIVVDLAHASPRMIDDVLAMATRPVVVSHGGVKGTCDNVRNLSDDHVRRVAATGGVIGIGYWDAAVCDVSVAGIVRAIQYAVGIAGIDHVGLGSDFDGATTEPFDTTGLPLITEGLLAAGFSEPEVAKIMGGNVLRVLQETLPAG